MKRFLTLFVSICIILQLLPGATVKAADSGNNKTAYERETEAAEQKKKELDKAAEELRVGIQDTDLNMPDMEVYILTVDNIYLNLIEEYMASEKELEEIKELVEISRRDLELCKDIEDEKYRIMKERIRYMYEEGHVSFSDVLFGSSGISDFLNRLEYRFRIMKYDNDVFTNYETARETAEQSEALLSARLGEMEAMQEYRRLQLKTMEELAEKKAKVILEASQSFNIDDTALFARWDEIVKAADEKDVASVLENIHEEDEASYKLENIMWPLPGKKYISSYFGYRSAPTEGATLFHSGIDIPANTGTEAKAALSGVVVAATYDPGAGYYVKISHGNGVYTSYCHASKLMVKVGDRVKKGQTVILVGSTGVSTGPHLHFGIQIGNSYTDPLDHVWYGKE